MNFYSTFGVSTVHSPVSIDYIDFSRKLSNVYGSHSITDVDTNMSFLISTSMFK